MFKKALQIATAFGMLLAGYAGYVHVFALLARGISASTSRAFLPIPRIPSKTYLHSINLAKQAFGRGHWSTADDIEIRLYNAERGFWMYARNYKRLGDGRQIEFMPFAVIMQSADGKSLKTATSDVARVELDQPFDLALKGTANSALRVVHARLEGNVDLRDDKGTPRRGDDLRIGPLTYLEYDEPTLQIDSESYVTIEDDVYRITGTGLLIKLRPKDDGLPHPPGAPTGFSDAQTAYLKKDVHIVIHDVGAGGILPGTAKPSSPRPGEATPLDLRCDGLMQIDLPKRPAPMFADFVGPPAPEGPTLAQFSRNVEVIRGTPAQGPDQLDCDHLRLTLVPPEKPAGGAVETEAAAISLDMAESAPTAAAPADGPAADDAATTSSMSKLTLKEAWASGHNVRLASTAQGIKARCNELIYKKQQPHKPDETYLRADLTSRVVVEKLDLIADGPRKGEVSTFTTIRTIDATIFDDARGNDYATILARGPGDMESRPGPGLDRPIERTARWDDTLLIQPETSAAARPGEGAATASKTAATTPVRKRITLTGRPAFKDIPAKATLDARHKASKIVIWLKPKPAAVAGPDAPKPATPKAETPGGGAFEIEQLYAVDDVHLDTPAKALVARDDLQAVFVPVDAPAASAPAATPKPEAKPTAGAGPDAPATTPVETPKAREPAPAEPEPPSARATADRVWARVFLLPATPTGGRSEGAAPAPGPVPSAGGTGDGRHAEVDEVRLRGTVTVHQDPAPGKARGTEIVGEAVDLFNQGGKGSRFIVYHHDPLPRARTSKPPASSAAVTPADDDLFKPLAMVDSDQMVIRGKVIGLDQAIDHAWVEGNGSLTQMAARNLLSEKGLAADQPKTGVAPVARPVPDEPEDGKDKDRAKGKTKENARTGDRAKTKAREKGEAEPGRKSTTPMTIFFAGDPKTRMGMRFYGQSKGPRGKIVARADFFKDVRAESEDAILVCAEVMRTYFDQPIKLLRPKTPKPDARPAADASAEADEPEPKPEIAVIECVKDVDVTNTKRDDEGKAIVQKQRILGDYLVYEKATGKFRVPGEGMVYLYEREGEGQGSRLPGVGPNPSANAHADVDGDVPARRTILRTAGPGRDDPAPIRRADAVVGRAEARAPADPNPRRGEGGGRGPAGKSRKPARSSARKPPPPMVLTQVHFSIEMNGRFGSGTASDKDAPRWADFFGDVETLRARVAGPDALLDPDRSPADAMFLTAQTMRVVSEPAPSAEVAKDADAPPRYLLRAWENAFAASDGRTVQADTITYDSRSNLFYAYGEEGRDVVLAQQDKIGNPATNGQGHTLMYNARTGQSQLVDPKSVALIDAKTGVRPVPIKPPKDKLEEKFQKRKKFQNLRGSIERKGYSGQ